MKELRNILDTPMKSMKKLLFSAVLLGGCVLTSCTPKDIDTNVSNLTMQVGDSFLLETYHIRKIHGFELKSECEWLHPETEPSEPKNVIALESVKKKTNVMVHAKTPGFDTIVVEYMKAGVWVPLEWIEIPVQVTE